MFGELEREPGMTVAVCPPARKPRHDHGASRPIRCATRRSAQLPVGADDLRVSLAGIARRAASSPPAMAQHSVEEITPGPGSPTEEAFADYVRQDGTTIYHIVGTCKMGDDPMAVVDPRLKVYGIAGLRVIDASVMPAVTTGNTNAPTIMIGEKGAAMIREDAGPNRSQQRPPERGRGPGPPPAHRGDRSPQLAEASRSRIRRRSPPDRPAGCAPHWTAPLPLRRGSPSREQRPPHLLVGGRVAAVAGRRQTRLRQRFRLAAEPAEDAAQQARRRRVARVEQHRRPQLRLRLRQPTPLGKNAASRSRRAVARGAMPCAAGRLDCFGHPTGPLERLREGVERVGIVRQGGDHSPHDGQRLFVPAALLKASLRSH